MYRISLVNADDSNAELAAITEADFDPAVGTTMLATFSYTATGADAGDTLRLICKGVPHGSLGGKVGLDDVSVRRPIPPQGTVITIR